MPSAAFSAKTYTVAMHPSGNQMILRIQHSQPAHPHDPAIPIYRLSYHTCRPGMIKSTSQTLPPAHQSFYPCLPHAQSTPFQRYIVRQRWSVCGRTFFTPIVRNGDVVRFGSVVVWIDDGVGCGFRGGRECRSHERLGS